MSPEKARLTSTERRKAIADLLAREGAVQVADLVARFQIDPATGRRDVDWLARQGLARRVHGGAVRLAPDLGADGGPAGRIGQAAAGLVVDGETLFLGPGPLALAVARATQGRSRLTIVTNSLPVAQWVLSNTRHVLIVTGGQADPRDGSLGGSLIEQALKELRADWVFYEVGGISAVDGLTLDSLSAVDQVERLLALGGQIVGLAQVEQVGRRAAGYVGPAESLDVLVVPREAPSLPLWDLGELGVRIVLA